MNRVIFIDGPEHGTTKTIADGEPERTIFMPERMRTVYNLKEEPSPESISINKYRYEFWYKTRCGTWVYEYMGSVR